MSKQRQAEVTDAHGLEEVEATFLDLPAGVTGAHGQPWRDRCDDEKDELMFGRVVLMLPAYRTYRTWRTGLLLLGVAALVILLNTVASPGELTGSPG